MADAANKKLPEPPDDFRFPKRLGEVVDAYGKFTDDVMTGKIDISALTADALATSSSRKGPGDIKPNYAASVLAPRSGPFDWASLLGIASSANETANETVYSQYRHTGNTNTSDTATLPKLPTLAGILLMQPHSNNEATAAAPDVATKQKNAHQAGGEFARRSGKPKKSASSLKKASKINKAIVANREGDTLVSGPIRPQHDTSIISNKINVNMTSTVTLDQNSLFGPSTATSQPKQKRGSTAVAKSKSAKEVVNAMIPKKVDKWTPWATSVANDMNNNTGITSAPDTPQSNRYFPVGNQFGMENSMALLPADTNSNFSIPAMLSPSQLMYLPGDNENSLALLPLDFSMSSPGKYN